MSIKGIDVSVWQGAIDWSRVKNSGIGFAILKAGGSDSGFYKDSQFERNYSEAKKYGVPVGAYYFVGSGFTSTADGVADAKRFCDLIKGKQFEYPICLDLESTPSSKKAGATDASIAFLDYLESQGYYAMIYGSEYSTFDSRVDKSRLKKYDKWVAHYDGYTPKMEYGIHQYSSSGSVSGISGRVDMNNSLNDYKSIIINGGYNGYPKKVDPQPQPKPTPTPAPTPTPTPTPSKAVDVFYKVKTQKHGWLPEVKNLADYAGWENSPIVGLAIKVSRGSVKYRVHIKGRGWLPYVSGYNINERDNGYAGDNSVIDAVEVYYYTPSGESYKRAKYRVNGYPWQYDNEKGKGMDGYAGALGVAVTKFQIVIE